jgi:hypothetical protein
MTTSHQTPIFFKFGLYFKVLKVLISRKSKIGNYLIDDEGRLTKKCDDDLKDIVRPKAD